MLMEDLPAFARSPLRLQWSPDNIPQRCVTPPFAPKALFIACSKPRCSVRWSHGQRGPISCKLVPSLKTRALQLLLPYISDFAGKCAPSICRYLVAQSADTLYVAFMGTKQFRDILTNADLRLVRLWPEEVHITTRLRSSPRAASSHHLSTCSRKPLCAALVLHAGRPCLEGLSCPFCMQADSQNIHSATIQELLERYTFLPRMHGVE